MTLALIFGLSSGSAMVIGILGLWVVGMILFADYEP